MIQIWQAVVLATLTFLVGFCVASAVDEWLRRRWMRAAEYWRRQAQAWEQVCHRNMANSVRLLELEAKNRARGNGKGWALVDEVRRRN